MAINHSLHFSGFSDGIESCHKICYLDYFSRDVLACNRRGKSIKVFQEFSKGSSTVSSQQWQSGEALLNSVHTAVSDLHIFLSHPRLCMCTEGL